ncbi:hypothetical protein Hypma_002772 [Hypsizygus marmoreus]|uniref:Fungal-type protein kinase domain-containing protein n=1 Tax=Hypsizygus marmoreus TaxID=39966 RepID=A0A369J7L6_HYPMA|nr:hypothetical protein Hypma_002772 [Hypsizygus marmoreus]
MYQRINAVEMDLRHRLRVADTKEFLDTFFPVPTSEHIHEMFASLLRINDDGRRIYRSRKKVWVGIKGLVEHEEDKFARLANTIRDATRATCQAGVVDDASIDGVWLDIPPLAYRIDLLEENAFIRPDVVLVEKAQVKDMKALDKEYRDTLDPVIRADRDASIMIIEGQQDRKRKATAKDDADNIKDNEEKSILTIEEQREKALDLARRWWGQVHVPLAIMRSGESRLRSHQRLLNHVQLVLTTQLDRRFAFGILLGLNGRLTVCLCDRSGAVFTQDPFSIHKDPKAFIRVMAGVSMLKPEQLGWDPAMNVFVLTTREIVRSYRLGPKDPHKNGRGTHWVIDLPSKAGPPEQVVTVRALAMPSEIICTRATIVWEVVRLVDLPKPKAVYVLKRFWRRVEAARYESIHEGPPSMILPEDDFYRALGIYTERIFYSGDAIVGGIVDSTLDFIRQGLTTTASSWEGITEPNAGCLTTKARSCRDFTGPDAEWYPAIARKYLKAAPYVHSDVVMKDLGINLTYFSSLMELLRVIRDCVKEHDRFCEKGVLHRDISPGNIVIVVPRHNRNGEEPLTKGQLIDFDHAKYTTRRTNTGLLNPNSDLPTDRKLEVFCWLLSSESLEPRVGKSLMSAAVNAFGGNRISAVQYLDYVIPLRERYFGLTAPVNDTYSCADLRWDKEDKDIPDFSDDADEKAHAWTRPELRHGTRPYMSYETLASAKHGFSYRYRDSSSPRPGFFHDSVHDMESFVWVIIEICLTRKGPGMNMLRDEFQQPDSTLDSPDATKLDDIYMRFFQADVQSITKARDKLLAEPKIMDDEIIPCFHPYFEPLKEMVLQLWHTLVLAYYFRAFEYHHIHMFFLDILSHVMEKYEVDKIFNGIGNLDTEREERRRKDYYEDALSTFILTDTIAEMPQTDTRAINEAKATMSRQKPGSTNSVPASPPRKKARLE